MQETSDAIETLKVLATASPFKILTKCRNNTELQHFYYDTNEAMYHLPKLQCHFSGLQPSINSLSTNMQH